MSLTPISPGFTIYQSPSCPYCREASNILSQLNRQYGISVRNIDFDQIEGGKARVLDYFRRYQDRYGFDTSHTTRPIIFFNGRFIGGNSELKQFLQANFN